MTAFPQTRVGLVFRALAADTRFWILEYLNRSGDWVDSRDLRAAVGLAQSNAAKHLRLLADAGLIEVDKRLHDERRHGAHDRYRITRLAVDLVARVVRDTTPAGSPPCAP